jgi:hypothetical protein
VAARILAICVVPLSTVAFAHKANVEFDQTADFTHYKTFAIRRGELNSRNPALNSELVNKQIEADIARDLTSRGLSQVESGPADLNNDPSKIQGKLGDMVKKAIEKYPPKKK